MDRLSLYLFRQLSVAFIFAAAAVTIVILFTQSFRLLTLVIDNAATMWFFFRLLALSVPTFLPLVLPLAVGVAVLFVYHRLAVDSELVVMRAVGVSPMRQARPALMLAGMVLMVCYALTLWITPAAHRHLVALQYAMKDNFAVLLSRPGNFNDITRGLTFYARERGAGGALEGILMHDVRKPETPVTIMAERGQIIENNGEPQLLIFNGRRQEMNVATGQLSQLAFEQYVVDINNLRSGQESRLADPRELGIFGLLFPGPDRVAAGSPPEKLTSEINQRLTSPLLAIAYALIGLAAILSGEFNRRGMGRRILVASLAIVATQAVTMSFISLIARHPWLAFGLYLTVLGPPAIGLMLLNFEKLRRFGHWVAGPFSARTASS